MSFSRLALSSIRIATRAWPFRLGSGLPTRLGAFATRIGLLKPAWYEFHPGLWMQLNARDLVQQTILLEGLWDPALTNFLNSNLGEGDVFVDVGAHVGYFTLLASQRVGRTGTVLSIEPNPSAVKQLSGNLERSRLQNVLVEHTACGDSLGVADLYLHSDSNSSMASFSTDNAASRLSVQVPCIALDDLCERRGLGRISLVKIDVEGAELFVLQGMSRIMRDMRPTIVLELEPRLLESVGSSVHAVAALLADCAYSLAPLGGHSNYVCRPQGTTGAL